MSVYFIEGNVALFSTKLTRFSVRLPVYASDLRFSTDEKAEKLARDGSVDFWFWCRLQ